VWACGSQIPTHRHVRSRTHQQQQQEQKQQEQQQEQEECQGPQGAQHHPLQVQRHGSSSPVAPHPPAAHWGQDRHTWQLPPTSQQQQLLPISVLVTKWAALLLLLLLVQ